MYNWSTNKQHTHSNKGVSVANSIHHSKHIYNYLKALNLGLFYPMCIWTTYWPSSCLFFSGDTGENSWFPRSQPLPQDNDRLFLNHGKWKDDALQDVLKAASSKPFIGKHSVPDNRFTVLWMIRLLHIPGLRHRRFIQSKLRIFINHI